MSLCSFAALRKDAQALLALINTLPQREWEKRLHGIFVRDPVQGPLAVAWMLQQVLKASTRQDAPFWCGQIDACKHAARVGHKVRCGWEAYGMTPYEVCMHRGYFRHPIYLGTTVSLCSALSVLCSVPAPHSPRRLPWPVKGCCGANASACVSAS